MRAYRGAAAVNGASSFCDATHASPLRRDHPSSCSAHATCVRVGVAVSFGGIFPKIIVGKLGTPSLRRFAAINSDESETVFESFGSVCLRRFAPTVSCLRRVAATVDVRATIPSRRWQWPLLAVRIQPRPRASSQIADGRRDRRGNAERG